MKIIAFRDNEKYYHMIHKLKKMEMFTRDLLECLEENKDEEDDEYEVSERRGRSMSRREKEHDDDGIEIVRRGRYNY